MPITAAGSSRHEWVVRERFVKDSGDSGGVTVYPDDESLVARTRSGDSSAFDRLVLRHRRRVTSVASRFFPQPHDAEDVAQEAFVRAFTQLEKLRDGVPFLNWLLRITINLSLDRLRHQRRRPEFSESQIGNDEAQSIERHMAHESKVDHNRALEAQEAATLLERVRNRLSPKDRAVLYLLYDEDRDVAEVAKILGWTRSNVKVRAFRARRFLKNELEQLLERGEAGNERK
jgi:RNA polymerase sigma-70 factor (ECF subfamily)